MIEEIDGKLKRTIQIDINSKLYKSIIASVQNKSPWSLDGKLYTVVGAIRIERTDNVRIELEEVEV